MAAPFLSEIEARIASADSSHAVACLTLEKGIYLARTDQIGSARDICSQIRASFIIESEPELFVWLNLLEGLLGFYSTATARDRIKLQRSFALAEAIGRTDLMQYAAAWLAHHHFNMGKYHEMATWLRESGLSRAINPSGKIRCCMTVADAWQFVSNNDVASGWYAIARKTAAEIGDRASIMASIENRAAMRLDRAWLKSIDADIEMDEISDIESELLGGLSYEKFTRSESLLYQASIWRSRLEVLKGNYDGALNALLAGNGEPLDVQASLAFMHNVDVAWIYFKLGQKDDAREAFQLAKDSCLANFDADDAAVYWRRMSVLDLELFDGLLSSEYSAMSRKALDSFGKELNDLERAIEEFQ